LAPAPVPLGAKSISSARASPTSAIVRSPVAPSNDARNGLRRPNAQISSRAPSAGAANGLPGGIAYGVPPRGSIRSNLPSSTFRF
jgi:hypothetical protein